MNRLIGIDLFRGIAAYAVILVHSGDATWGLPIDRAAESFRLQFYFAVPFFLATSFYLMVNRPRINISQKFWRSRIERILIPYFIWTIIYVVFKLALSLTNVIEDISYIIEDLWAVIFFGAASYHLYFLPLIFTGSCLVFLAKYIKENKIETKTLCLIFILSITAYQILLWSGNSFQLGANVAFDRLLSLFDSNSISYTLARVFLVGFAWLIRCLPYLLASIILVNLSSKKRLQFNLPPNLFIICLLFVLTNSLGQEIIPSALWEIILSFSLLIIAIGISKYIKPNQIIVNLGLCSFGIYLIHPLVKSAVEIVLQLVIPGVTQSVSVTSMIIYSGSTFILSWYTVTIFLKNRLIAKYMFGV